MVSKMTKLICVSLLHILCGFVGAVHAQSEERRIEIAGQFSFLSFSTPTSIQNASPAGASILRDRIAISGVGSRIGYNVSRSMALEAEVNIHPRDRVLEGGSKAQLLAGAKFGRRFDRVGVFAKIRPGFIRESMGDYTASPGALCGAIIPSPISCFKSRARTNFNLDVGAVLEIYPTERTILRFDAGDTIIRRGERVAAMLNPPPAGTFGPTVVVGIPVGSETSHNLQLGIGFGFRF